MSDAKLVECSSCLGTGETVHRTKKKGLLMTSDCHVCKGVGMVESIINDHFVHEELFD